MPVYIFKKPGENKYVEVFQKMKDPHTYEDESGKKWERVFTSPNANSNTQLVNANTTAEGFINKTKEKNYSLGDMWDLSRDLSEKRKNVAGIDHVKEKAKKNYERKCKKPHPLG